MVDLTSVGDRTGLALQMAFSDTFSGYIISSDPFLALSQSFFPDEMFSHLHNLGYGAGNISQSSSNRHQQSLSYQVNSIMLRVGEDIGDQTSFKSIRAGGDSVIRTEHGKYFMISATGQLKGEQKLFFDAYNRHSSSEDTISLSSEAFSYGKKIQATFGMNVAFQEFAKRMQDQARRDFLCKCNVVFYDETNQSSMYDYKYLNASIVQCLRDLQNINRGYSSTTRGIRIIADPNVMSILTSNAATAYLGSAQQYNSQGIGPLSGNRNRLSQLDTFVINGNTYVRYDNAIRHVSGTASALTDLKISTAPIDGDTTIKLTSVAASTAFTIKKGDILRVNGKKFLTRVVRRTTEDIAAASYSSVALCLIAQEDASATGATGARTVTVKISPTLYDNENVKLSDMAVDSAVAVIPTHRKICVMNSGSMYTDIVAPPRTKSNVEYHSFSNVYSGYQNLLSNSSNRAFAMYSVSDEGTPTNEFLDLYGFRSYMTNFAFEFQNAQIIIPDTDPSAIDYAARVYVEALLPADN